MKDISRDQVRKTDELVLLVPTYNRQESLELLLNSIEEFTGECKILTIVRDNSESSNGRVIQRQQRSRNLIYHKNDHNLGARENIVLLLKDFLKESQSEFAVFVEDDDAVIKSLAQLRKQLESRMHATFQVNSQLTRGGRLIGVTYPIVFGSLMPTDLLIDAHRVLTGSVINRESAKAYIMYGKIDSRMHMSYYPMQIFDLVDANHGFVSGRFFRRAVRHIDYDPVLKYQHNASRIEAYKGVEQVAPKGAWMAKTISARMALRARNEYPNLFAGIATFSLRGLTLIVEQKMYLSLLKTSNVIEVCYAAVKRYLLPRSG